MDFLKSAVAAAGIAKGPSLPYSFGEQVPLDQSIWKLYNGNKKDNKSECTIFAFDILENKSRLPLARNAVKKLRTLRHPGVIKVLDTIETETQIYVVTERLVPLQWPVRRKSLSEETIKWGLYTIATTMAFVNEEALSVHGNLRTTSIFISPSGEWRLGGFEVLSSMKDDEAIIYNYGSLTPDSARYAAPEVAKTGWDAIKRHPLPALDAYAFGVLICEICNGGSFTNDQIGQTKNIPPSIHQCYKRLLNANPKARLSISQFREQGRRNGGFFETPLIKLSEGLESLGLKSDEERAELLSELDQVSDDFPEEYFTAKVLPELLKSVEFGGGGPRVLASVIKISAGLSDEQFGLKVTPVIVRLFGNPDRAIRVCLLDNLPKIIERLSPKVVNDKIFPQMVTGFSDVAPAVREQTVKAVLVVVYKLSDRILNGELLKHLAKTANDEQPGIRTNTTICLGKIARNLGANTRQKVLTAAFARGLRDPFVHARSAALQALAATSDLFNEDDCATKVLPSLCPSLVDKEKIVREQANKTFDIYVQRIRKYGATLPDSVLPPPSTTNGTNAPRIGTPQNDTGWAGWAISSFTNKLSAANGEIQPKQSTPLPAPTDSIRPATAASTTPSTSISTTNLHRQALTSSQSASNAPVLTRTSTDHFFAAAQAEDDDLDAAWGDMDDEGNTFFDAPTTEEAARSKPSTTTTATTAAAAAVPYDDGGEPDFEGWLKAQASAKSGKPLPKGLAPKGTGAGAGAGAKPGQQGAGVGKPSVVRGTTTGSIGQGVGAKKLAGTGPKMEKLEKVIDTKPKVKEEEDDWGDAWD